jgi:hypothetical protein
MGDTMTKRANPNALRKGDVIAMDRMTVRSVDVDGRMHVEMTNISKANVCPYYGAEIPNYEGLGLDPNRVYMLYRDPVELSKGAATFNGIQLMGKHIPVSATDTQKFDVVGCLGNDAVFEPPYLKNSLTVWDASAIAGIETGDQRELSSSYRYVADMTPGVAEGAPFDGRMTDIVGNHVALVETGRAGADVTVGDSLPPELLPMKLSKKAVAMRAALGAYLRPLLAQDGTIPQLRAIVRGNKKPAFVAMDAKSVFKDLDLNVDDLTRVLTLACDEAEEEEDGKADDEEETEEEKAAREKKASDEADEEAKKKAEDEEAEEAKKKEDGKANDAAFARVRSDARQDALREFTAIRQAEEDVRPLVGAVVAMDSAEAVYRFALDSIGVDAKGVHASALPTLVGMAKDRQVKPQAARVAMDAAAESSFAARFPTATKLKRA